MYRSGNGEDHNRLTCVVIIALVLLSCRRRFGLSPSELSAHGNECRGVFGGIGEVLVFGSIVFEIVKLLAIRPDGVTPTVRANRFAEFVATSDDRIDGLLSGGCRIKQHRHKTAALQIVGPRYVAEFGERWVEVYQFDQPFTG